MAIVFGILGMLMGGALIYGLWQPAVRISQITVYGSDQSFASIASSTMRGTYVGVIPRNSIFFVSESRIRHAILATHPAIAAVSVFRSGFSHISIRVDYRVPVARWCNVDAPMGTTTPNAPCYVFDADGFVYATSSTSTRPLNGFTVDESIPTEGSAIGITLPDAPYFPAAFDFARQLGTTFGSPVTDVVFNGTQADDYLASGTRVMYVAGQESASFTALVSARADFNLADGSVLYADLRFPGKIYLKRR